MMDTTILIIINIIFIQQYIVIILLFILLQLEKTDYCIIIRNIVLCTYRFEEED